MWVKESSHNIHPVAQRQMVILVWVNKSTVSAHNIHPVAHRKIGILVWVNKSLCTHPPSCTQKDGDFSVG